MSSKHRIYKKDDYPQQIPIVTKDKIGNTVIKFETIKEKLGMKDPSINYVGIHEKLW